MAKSPGAYAPDGSQYATRVTQVGAKLNGAYSPDGALYTTKAS